VTEETTEEMTEQLSTSGRRPVSRRVHAPAEAVWAVVSDGWLYANWVVGTSRVRAVDPGWPAEGRRIHHSFGVWPAVIDDETVSLEAEPGERLLLRARGWPMGEARVQLSISEQQPDSCLVTIVEDAVAGPGLVVPRPARQVAIAVRNTEALRRLALIAEGRHREWTGTE
jgi:hypothetical protein